MKVKINRYDPDTQREWIQEYEVDTSQRSMTVMDVLDYIQNHLDHSLAYYRHSICNHGICGRCAMKINGKTYLSCLALANDYESLELAPVTTAPVVRDLVVDNQMEKQ